VREVNTMLDRNGILARLTQAREDIDAVINTVLQGDKRRVSWTRLLAPMSTITW